LEFLLIGYQGAGVEDLASEKRGPDGWLSSVWTVSGLCWKRVKCGGVLFVFFLVIDIFSLLVKIDVFFMVVIVVVMVENQVVHD
jgi:hypothetical protein